MIFRDFGKGRIRNLWKRHLICPCHSALPTYSAGAVQIQATKQVISIPGLSAVVWIISILTLVFLPFRLLNHGFLPPDDALRYAARAVSGKSWQDIVVMRPEITVDHNYGWNYILGSLHLATGWDPAMLVAFSVVAMFLVFAISPLPWLRRPELWLASLTLVMLVFPYFAARVALGRPLLLTMGATVMLLCLWTSPGKPETSRKTILLSIALVSIAVWVHGSWYLLVLLPAAFFFAGAWRQGLTLTFCWLVGSLVGALFTGRPWAFLSESVLIPFLALGQDAPLRSLVAEFHPFTEGYPPLILIGLVLAWRKLAGRPMAAVFRDPIFLLALMGLFLGFRVVRFWLDWGIPALALWLARQFEDLLETNISAKSWLRAALTVFVALLLFAGVASDRDRRWSQYGRFDSLDASRPEHKEWVPEPGGILYNVNLSVFYETFFNNPHAGWRYALGYEPSFMRAEDYAIYQDLWQSLNAARACAPWVSRMTSSDRLVLVSGPHPQPAIPGLEWYYAASNTWVGRLPKTVGEVGQIRSATQ